MSMSTHLRKFLFILILSFNKQKVYLFKSPFKYKMIWQCLSVSSGPGFLDKPKSKHHLMLPCGCRLLAGRRGFVGIKDCHAELGKCSSDCPVQSTARPQSSTTRINGLGSRLFRCMAEVWSGKIFGDDARFDEMGMFPSFSLWCEVSGVCTVESVSLSWHLIGCLVTISASHWSVAAISHRPSSGCHPGTEQELEIPLALNLCITPQ